MKNKEIVDNNEVVIINSSPLKTEPTALPEVNANETTLIRLIHWIWIYKYQKLFHKFYGHIQFGHKFL